MTCDDFPNAITDTGEISGDTTKSLGMTFLCQEKIVIHQSLIFLNYSLINNIDNISASCCTTIVDTTTTTTTGIRQWFKTVEQMEHMIRLLSVVWPFYSA